MLSKQSLSNLKLSKLGADISTGNGYYLGERGSRISIGDTLRNVNRNGFLGADGMPNGSGDARVAGYYSATDLSFSQIFGSGDTVGNNLVYIKSTPYSSGMWRSDLSPYYTSNSGASGAMIAGTNGDLNGSFIGYGPNYESYYMWGGNSKHWRIGTNIYRLSADGTEFQRVYTWHHVTDSIGDQSSVSLGLGGMEPSSNLKYTGTIYRLQDTGNPTAAIGAYNISTNQLNNNAWMSRNAINGVNQWGQPLDAIDVGSSASGLRTGLFLWQRQWWGPRLVLFNHNGSSITTQNAQSMDVFYQGWIYEHNFGGQGGVAWSPHTNKVVTIFTYEPNGTTYGRNMAINSITINPDAATFDSPPETDIIHFIWGGNDQCKPDYGQYSGGHIDWMAYHPDFGDIWAYAFLNVSQNRIIVRLASVNWDQWQPGNNRCNWPEAGQYIYTGVNSLQRCRVTRLHVIDDNGQGGPTVFFALSYVNSSNQTVVKIYRGGPSFGLFEIASYIPNNRGLLARNGGGSQSNEYGWGTGQHAIVMGTTNDGAQTTYTWDGSKSSSLSRAGDQDQTLAIKLV